MIDRYSRTELKEIWSETNKYKIWLDIEIAAAQAMEKYKLIPRGVSSIVKRKAKVKVKRIHAIEAKVKHDVIAFLTSITMALGPLIAGMIHDQSGSYRNAFIGIAILFFIAMFLAWISKYGREPNS